MIERIKRAFKRPYDLDKYIRRNELREAIETAVDAVFTTLSIFAVLLFAWVVISAIFVLTKKSPDALFSFKWNFFDIFEIYKWGN